MAFKAWRQLTPYLVFNSVVFLQGALLFGIDTGSFGSLQALPSFVHRFGVENASGVFKLPASRTSLMNSLPWIGKLTGCLGSDAVIDRVGYKKTMYAAAIIQIVALLIEMTSRHWAQFTVGRIIAYSAVGLVENAVPAYNAETSPAATRGLLSGSIILITSLGNLWGSGMSRAYAKEPTDKGWLIPTAMQFIPAIGILALVPFTPESPRWLLLKGRKESAKASLDKIRHKHEVESGATAAEVDALEHMIEEAQAADSASWLELFRGNYLRRTWICVTLFVLEQTNGNQFVQSYGATFYVQQGLGSMSFTYATVGQVVGVIGCAFGVLLFDISGRRPLFIYGSVVCAFLLYLASGFGTIRNPNQSEVHILLACFILLPAFTRISASNNAFLTGAEIGGVKMRKKTMALGTACDVLAAFLVTFVTPYLLPHMGPNIGWIFGSVAAFSVIWGIFFFPELKAKCTGRLPCHRCQARGYECATRRDNNNVAVLHATEPLLPTPGSLKEMSSPQSFFGADQPAERGYIQAYFDKTKSASCVFLHRPTVLSKWSQGKLDPTLLKALLAAGRRFTRGLDDDIVQPLMRDAHSAILARLNKFSVSRLQALVLVIQFRLQAGDTVEAWNLMSLAARFAFTLRLNYERPDLDDVTRESHRRLFWAIYLLDRLFASGIEDLSLCPLDRIHIRLPCDDRSFERGIASRAEYFKQDAASERCIMDPLAYLIRLYECRENILRHTKQVRREGISPAATADKQVALQAELNDFEASLPDHLQHKPQCLPIVAYSGDAHSFFLIHSIWLQCHCDLYRFFIPGIRESVSGAVAASTPAEYVDFCTANCLDSALKLCDFWSDMLKLWSADVIEETMVDVSIYQVAQVLHSLHHLLPRTGPHSIEALKSALQNTLDVVSTSRNRVSRSSPGLEAAERLVRLLGQATTTSKTRRSPQENIHHLPSHGSLIPETCSSDEAEPSRQPVQYTPHGAVMNTGEGDAAVASVGGLPQSDLIFPVRRSACLLKAISR